MESADGIDAAAFQPAAVASPRVCFAMCVPGPSMPPISVGRGDHSRGALNVVAAVLTRHRVAHETALEEVFHHRSVRTGVLEFEVSIGMIAHLMNSSCSAISVRSSGYLATITVCVAPAILCRI